jgi:hypothetical protein
MRPPDGTFSGGERVGFSTREIREQHGYFGIREMIENLT